MEPNLLDTSIIWSGFSTVLHLLDFEMKHVSYIDWIIEGLNSMNRIKTTPLLVIEHMIF